MTMRRIPVAKILRGQLWAGIALSRLACAYGMPAMEDPRVTAMPDCRAERPLESGEILFGYAGGDTAFALLRVKQGRIQRAYGLP